MTPHQRGDSTPFDRGRSSFLGQRQQPIGTGTGRTPPIRRVSRRVRAVAKAAGRQEALRYTDVGCIVEDG